MLKETRSSNRATLHAAANPQRGRTMQRVILPAGPKTIRPFASSGPSRCAPINGILPLAKYLEIENNISRKRGFYGNGTSGSQCRRVLLRSGS